MRMCILKSMELDISADCSPSLRVLKQSYAQLMIYSIYPSPGNRTDFGKVYTMHIHIYAVMKE